MTVRELADMIGRRGFLDVDELEVPVKIDNARTVYGQIQYLVTPIGGTGARWVMAYRFVSEIEPSSPDTIR